MNKILKKILLTAKDVGIETAASLVPGSSILISGITRLLDKDDTNNSGALAEIENGLITALQSLKPGEINDALLLAEGLKELEEGFKKVRMAVK